MAKFIEVKMVGKKYREYDDDGKIYHLPDHKEFFGVFVKPVAAKINLDCICDACIVELPVAHLHRRLVVRNSLFRWLFIREEETELRLEEDGTYKACVLLLAYADRTEVIYVAPETYDMLEGADLANRMNAVIDECGKLKLKMIPHKHDTEIVDHILSVARGEEASRENKQ